MSKAKPIVAVSKYVKELGDCLKKYSVEELLKFNEDHKDIIGRDKVEKFKNSSSDVQKITLWKMILIRTDMPQYLKNKAAADYGFWKGQHEKDKN